MYVRVQKTPPSTLAKNSKTLSKQKKKTKKKRQTVKEKRVKIQICHFEPDEILYTWNVLFGNSYCISKLLENKYTYLNKLHHTLV